jgi:hypothetical protein
MSDDVVDLPTFMKTFDLTPEEVVVEMEAKRLVVFTTALDDADWLAEAYLYADDVDDWLDCGSPLAEIVNMRVLFTWANITEQERRRVEAAQSDPPGVPFKMTGPPRQLRQVAGATPARFNRA